MIRHLMPLLAIAAYASLAVSAARAEDPAARWTGAYAGGDLGGATAGGATSDTAAAPCHVGCRGNGATFDGRAGYGSDLGHGFVGGAEGDAGR